MLGCRRCPHHVRHGQIGDDGRSIEFSDLCGLKIKAIERSAEAALKDKPVADKKTVPVKDAPRFKCKTYPKSAGCIHVPFPNAFEYQGCDVYVKTFKIARHKNDVVPTKDFQYSDAFAGSSITDLELL